MPQSLQLQQALSKNGSVYVSITGLKINAGLFAFLTFWRHSIPSKFQAHRSPGLLFLEVKACNGFQHTLSVWEDKQAMRQYIGRGAHLLAMRAFKKIATGRTYGYEATNIPNWEEALMLWHNNAKTVS